MNIRSVLNQMLTVLYPNRCIFCSRLIDAKEDCCAECAELLHRSQNLSSVYEVKPIPNCDRLFFVYHYTQLSKQAVFRLKFHGDRTVGRKIADLMADRVEEALLEDSILPKHRFDLVIPVPMYPSHERKRGYNQSKLLAKRIAGRLQIPYAVRLLYKVKCTKKQHDISYQDRQTNLLDAFYVPKSQELIGKRILLVDDVSTSGNTFSQCAKTLKSAGVTEVSCVAFLHQPARCKVNYYLKEWEPGRYKVKPTA